MTPREEFDQYWLARQRKKGFGDMLTDAEMLAYPERRDDEFHAWSAGRALEKKELDALRRLAAGQCVTQKVIDELGPIGLWSDTGLERHVQERIAQAAPTWRCFHCNECFTDHGEALLHFGPGVFSEPACKIDAKHLRELEEELRRYREEDTDLHRQMNSMRGDHITALQREEEKGYARGLRDAKKHPEELGLMPIPGK